MLLDYHSARDSVLLLRQWLRWRLQQWWLRMWLLIADTLK
ncbi:hypothetical protein RUMCAL_02900 [Ruminococcus callidus ATCC 27760]|uniref:Uncharacterized protein n=1 Tax=Ruminococcus callidus ATCC 27760 TaxID=411473 RepID=U2LKA9_9FIRM|nr:hypothetical protein RUMCAL_02900 [Ruminococcus callidus ATCC 27760]